MADEARLVGYYLPVARWCLARLAESQRWAAAVGQPAAPLLLGIQGPQGCGKSTLAAALAVALPQVGVSAVALSIDDLYLTHAEQQALAAAHPGHRYLQYRGYPGSHDVALGAAVLQALRRGEALELPAYDKSAHGGRGDRLPRAQWRRLAGRVDVVLLEGWMLGFAPLTRQDRGWSAELDAPNRLLAGYQPWYPLIEAMILLQAKRLKDVVDWRVDAERARRQAGQGALSDAEARDYIQRFLPAYRAWLPPLLRRPLGRAQLRIELGADRLPLRPVAVADLSALQRRPAQPDDLAALLDLVQRTLRPYVERSLGPWDAAGARGSIAASLQRCDWQLLSLDGQALGAIAVARSASELRLAELFIEPAFQGQGWGAALVQALLCEARGRGLPVRLRVLRSNPAQRLYARLGFAVEQASPQRLEMVAWPAAQPPGADHRWKAG